MAAAAGKKSATSFSLFMEAFGLEVEEELSTMATQTWAEGAWIGKWHMEQKEAWLNTEHHTWETSERTCRSGDVRDPRCGHQVAALTYLDFRT